MNNDEKTSQYPPSTSAETVGFAFGKSVQEEGVTRAREGEAKEEWHDVEESGCTVL